MKFRSVSTSLRHELTNVRTLRPLRDLKRVASKRKVRTLHKEKKTIMRDDFCVSLEKFRDWNNFDSIKMIF